MISEPNPLTQLRENVAGNVVTPEDSGYDAAHAAWNLTSRQAPRLIVQAHRVDDVRAALRYAQKESLPVAVQCTGHGLHRGCNDGVLIVTRDLNHVTVDPVRKTARVGAGAIWIEVLVAAQKFGLAALSGSTPHIGVSGYLLGGGYSLLSRKYGMAMESVRSLNAVLADGSLIHASANENSDLFWAMQGGGGAFGVVVEFEIDLVEQAEVFGGTVIYPVSRGTEIFTKYVEWSRDLPEEVGCSSIALMSYPDMPFVPPVLRGNSFVVIGACVTDVARGPELLRPMRELGHAVMDSFGVLPYEQSGLIYRDPVHPTPGYSAGYLLRDLTPESVTSLVRAVGPVELSPNLKIEIRQIGGAIARGDHARFAIGRRREAKYLIHVVGIPSPANSPERLEAHADEIFKSLEDQIMGLATLNFVGRANLRDQVLHNAFDEADFKRLRELKSKYDPKNLFRFSAVGLA